MVDAEAISGESAVCMLCRDEIVTLHANVNGNPYWTCQNRRTTINCHDDDGWGWVAQFVGKDVADVPSGVEESDPPLRVESSEESNESTEDESGEDPDWFHEDNSGEQDGESADEATTDERTVEEILSE